MFSEKGLEQCRMTEGAVLLDVRTEEEYRQGHLEGSKNIPLDRIEDVYSVYPDRNKPLFLYCQSGMRALKAAAVLQGMGYLNVTTLGGIEGYRDPAGK